MRLELSELVSKWKSFIDQVRGGYSRSIYEYDNDLATRRLLEEQLSELPLDTQIRREVALLDEEFRSLTRERKRPMRYQRGWWYNRVPLVAGSELEADLKEAGE